MNPLERIGNWLAPIARGMGVIEKGHPIVEPTSQTVTESSDLYNIIWGSGYFQDVHPILAYRLSLKSDVLGSVIHRIAHNIAGFTLGLTSDDQDFEDNAPVIQFLNMASEGYSKRRFFYEIATSYELTNEAWMVLRGRVDRPPVGRTWVYAFDVIDQQNSIDGLPTSFRTIGDRDKRVYNRVERRGRMRWISEDGMNELVPILGAEALDRPFRGQSPVAPLLYSVQQNVEGKRHNSSLVKGGLRLTGALMPESGDRFDGKAMQDIMAAIQAMRGAATAGGTLVLPKRAETLDLAISNREMDYVALLKEAKESVYNYYNIPLPLVSNEASTFNNFTTAQTALFDGAIFPVFDDIADALTAALEPRFPELAGHRITYNENTIRALKGRNIERMQKMQATNALTIDEVRAGGGYDKIDGGDAIYIPSTLIPLGDDGGEIPVSEVPNLDDMPDDEEPIMDEEPEETVNDGEQT